MARNLLILFVATLVGAGLSWLLLRGDGDAGGAPYDEPALIDYPPLDAPDGTGVLSVRLRAPDGSTPFGAEVGYQIGDALRLYPAGEDGLRSMADVPAGTLVVIGRAPGYEEARQERILMTGLPLEVNLILRPERR